MKSDNSLRFVPARNRIRCGVAFLVNSYDYYLQNASCISIRTTRHRVELFRPSLSFITIKYHYDYI